MSTASSDVDAVRQLGLSLARYEQESTAAAAEALRAARRVGELVAAALAERQVQLATAERELARCEADPKNDCGGARQRVATAQRRLEAARQASATAQPALTALVAARQRLASVVAARVGEGQRLTARMQQHLEDFLRPIGGAGGVGGNASPARPGAAAGSAAQPPGVRVAPGMPAGYALVPLSLIDTAGKGVSGPADFAKGYSPADLAWSFEAFDSVVLPALAHGLGADYFASRDGAEGRMGCRSFSDSHSGFLGGDAIALDRRPDGTFAVTNGYHRIWVAQQAGRQWVPARIL